MASLGAGDFDDCRHVIRGPREGSASPERSCPAITYMSSVSEVFALLALCRR